jgi:hypothetical protein
VNTFFCNRTTLVHFFSSSPSYFFRVASSKLGDTLTSSRNAAAVFGAFITPKYAIIALFLPASRQCCVPDAAGGALTALQLGVRSISCSWRKCVLMRVAGGGDHRRIAACIRQEGGRRRNVWGTGLGLLAKEFAVRGGERGERRAPTAVTGSDRCDS